jgi:bacterioferritin (cytochrome b1)
MRLVCVLALAAALVAQQRGRNFPREPDPNDIRLPSGKSQRQEMLKADLAKSKTEAAELVELAQQLKEELDKSEYQVVNLKLVKKAEEIEKLAKRIKDRMRRY